MLGHAHTAIAYGYAMPMAMARCQGQAQGSTESASNQWNFTFKNLTLHNAASRISNVNVSQRWLPDCIMSISLLARIMQALRRAAIK